MENNNSVSSALVVYIWMHHTLKNIRQNSTFFDSKSANHETFVIGKFIFRISHDFFMSLRGQNCGYSFKIPLSHLFPRIISRYSTCHGRNFEALFAFKSYLVLASTSRFNWRFCIRKFVSNLSQPCRLTFKALTTASYMYTGIRRHVP